MFSMNFNLPLPERSESSLSLSHPLFRALLQRKHGKPFFCSSYCGHCTYCTSYITHTATHRYTHRPPHTHHNQHLPPFPTIHMNYSQRMRAYTNTFTHTCVCVCVCAF